MQYFAEYTQWICFCSIHFKIFFYYLIGKKIRREIISLIFRILAQFVELDSGRISSIHECFSALLLTASQCLITNFTATTAFLVGCFHDKYV